MYKGEFKNGARYELDNGVVITYIGLVGKWHYVIYGDNSNAINLLDENLRDIIEEEIKTPITITGYGNIYEHTDCLEDIFYYNTREEADKDADPDRTSCVKVTITYTEGQFDD